MPKLRRCNSLSAKDAEERNTKIQEMLDDGASLLEIIRSGVASAYWMQRYYPAKGWTHEQIVAHAILVRNMNRKVRF